VTYQMGDVIGAGEIAFVVPSEVRDRFVTPTKPHAKKKRPVRSTATPKAQPVVAASPPSDPSKSPIHDEVARRRERPTKCQVGDNLYAPARLEAAVDELNAAVADIKDRYPGTSITVSINERPDQGPVGKITASVLHKVG